MPAIKQTTRKNKRRPELRATPTQPTGVLSVWDGERVRQMRLIKGLKQAELALLVDVNWRTVGHWETSHTRRPTRTLWPRLQEINDTPSRELRVKVDKIVRELRREQDRQARDEERSEQAMRRRATAREIDALVTVKPVDFDEFGGLPDLPEGGLDDKA